MFWISVATSPIFWVPAARPSTTVLVRRASLAALVAIAAERVTCWAMLLIDAVSSSVADATVSTFEEACVEAVAAGARFPGGWGLVFLLFGGRALLSPGGSPAG